MKEYGLDCYRLYNQRTTILFLFDPVHDKCWATSDRVSVVTQITNELYGVDRRLIGRVMEIMHELYGMKKIIDFCSKITLTIRYVVLQYGGFLFNTNGG